ncbi:MAG: hypothetical protein LIQ31_07815 [Planctomycetes bacterium]|nr:hypothetical protein [Planctomycetota bacterium]
MIDKMAVGERFFSCYPKMSWSEAARFFQATESYVVTWKTKGQVPWKMLKKLSDSQGISWDWLLDGFGDKYSGKTPAQNFNPKFPTKKVNNRFLSLFAGLGQSEIAQQLGLTVCVVSNWVCYRYRVPWRWLEYAVDTFGVNWNWLLDGLAPQYRSNNQNEVNVIPYQSFTLLPERKLDRHAIGARFLSCYPGLSKLALAKLFQVSRVNVVQWRTQGALPWSKMKYLSDSQAISWDWLLEGVEPKESVKPAKRPRSLDPIFPTEKINRRFFSLFPRVKQIDIARMLGVTDGMVNSWKQNRAQVPWGRLAAAVHAFNLRWDWLIDGLPPKRRE